MAESGAPSNLLDVARQRFPILGKYPLGYKESFGSGNGFLEFWPASEIGAGRHLRPQSIPLGQPGIEIYNPNTSPLDVMGDVVSHYLVNVDPQSKNYFSQFESSLTPQQQDILHEQYLYAIGQGERRPFDEWKKMSGLPAYFRGYAFKQWPEDQINKFYTPEQIKMFDEMMLYFQGK